MGRDVVQCGRKVPEAEEPAAWVLREMCVTSSRRPEVSVTHLLCLNVNITYPGPEFTVRLFGNN